MDGLEIRESLLSDVINNKDARIDSQFYTQQTTKNKLLKYQKIGDILLNSQYGISIAMNEDNVGYPIYRMNEIHNMLCDLDVDKCANVTAKEALPFTLNDRDVVFNRTNSLEWVGRTGLFRKSNAKDFIFASYLVRFVPNEKFILPEYLTTFLNSKFGVQEIRRRARQSINQTNVNPEEVKSIEIPLLSLALQNKIKECFDIAFKKLIEHTQLYQEAEQLLLDELGLSNFKPSNENISIRKLSDSFGASGRLDSEYYQPKYNNIAEHIKLGNHKVLSNIVHIRKSIEPGSDAYCEEGVEFIRVSNISKFGITKSDICLPVDFLPETEYNTLKPKPGTILLSKDGSVGIAYRIKNKMECITSGALLHLNIKDECLDKIMPEYLTLVLNSVLVQMQAERDAGGSIIQHWKPSEIEQILIPCLDIQHQCLIEDKIKSSFQLKEQSQQLLDLAKHAIELAIEQNETASVNYITNHISKEFA